MSHLPLHKFFYWLWNLTTYFADCAHDTWILLITNLRCPSTRCFLVHPWFHSQLKRFFFFFKIPSVYFLRSLLQYYPRICAASNMNSDVGISTVHNIRKLTENLTLYLQMRLTTFVFKTYWQVNETFPILIILSSQLYRLNL